MDSDDSQNSSGPDSPANVAASQHQDESSQAAPDRVTRSGSESRSSSSSASDGEDKSGNTGRDVEEDGHSNNSSRRSDTNPAKGDGDDEQDSRQSKKEQVSGSDGEIDGEDDGGQRRRRNKSKENGTVDGEENEQASAELEDLSDVSDLDSPKSAADDDEEREKERKNSKKSIRSSLNSNGTVEDNNSTAGDKDGVDAEENDHKESADNGQKSPIVAPPVCDLRQKLNAKKKATEESPTKRSTIDDDLKKTDEDELDFEAEDGECNDEPAEPKATVRMSFIFSDSLCFYFKVSLTLI